MSFDLPEQNADVIVIGAGISGLTAAWHLSRARRRVLLLERQSEVGGAMQTTQRDGFLLEKGPFNVIVRDPSFEELLDGLADRITVVGASKDAHKRYLYRHGAIHAVPTGPHKLFSTPLLSKRGALRALRGLCFSARNRDGEPTIAEFATRRFGAEVSDTMVSAVVAGIMAGDINKLSAYACFPVLRDFDARSISPLGRTFARIPNMLRKRWNPSLQRKWKGLVSVDVGLGGLAAAIANAVDNDAAESNVLTNTTVVGIDPPDDSETHWRVRFVDESGAQQTATAPHVVLGTSLDAARDLIHPLLPDAAEILANIESSSLVVLNMAFRKSDIAHPLDGFGFLVPHNEPDFPLMGVLFADSAFPHHAPDGMRLLRVFMGGSRTPEILARDTDELNQTARDALRDVLGVSAAPAFVDACPWPDALPQFYRGHAGRIARLREIAGRLPGLHLAGNYLDGVSINDCVKLGKQVGLEVHEALEGASDGDRSRRTPASHPSTPTPA